MININRILKDNRLMRATTGLSLVGFENLCVEFAKSRLDIKEKQYQKGVKTKMRQRRPGGGRKGNLTSIELKLLFILLYFKCYPTMDLTGLIFDLDRSNVKHNVDNFTPVLEKALGKTLSLPKRKIRTLEEFFELIPEAKDLFVDGTERPTQRPKNSKKQKDNYSGKKKAHTKKNLVINGEKKRVAYLGKTAGGKEHDYAIFKNEFDPKTVPKDITLWMDKGFTGAQKDYPDADIMMPKRKPREKELSAYDKEQNKTISGIRILSEHTIGGVKRLKIITDKFRNKSDKFNDKVMFLSCGLWNYHLDYC